jgi:hypothetical protein
MVSNKYIIMKATGLSEIQYAEMVMDYAQGWMNRYFSHVPITIDALNHSKHFWKWWTNQWENRDALFIKETQISFTDSLPDVTTRELTKWLYQSHHNPMDLLIVPNRFVVREVGGLIKKQEHLIKDLESK